MRKMNQKPLNPFSDSMTRERRITAKNKIFVSRLISKSTSPICTDRMGWILVSCDLFSTHCVTKVVSLGNFIILCVNFIICIRVKHGHLQFLGHNVVV